MAATGTAPAPERSPLTINPLLEKLLLTAGVAAITWALTTAQASAVQQQRLVAVEEVVKSKASNEKVDALQREILSRLERMENKLDRADKRAR